MTFESETHYAIRCHLDSRAQYLGDTVQQEMSLSPYSIVKKYVQRFSTIFDPEEG
jgi:hypothetical protein